MRITMGGKAMDWDIPKTQISLLGYALRLDRKNKSDPRWPFRPVGILHTRAVGLAKRGLLRSVGPVDGAEEFKITAMGRRLAAHLRNSENE